MAGRMRASTHTIPWHVMPGDRFMRQAVLGNKRDEKGKWVSQDLSQFSAVAYESMTAFSDAFMEDLAEMSARGVNIGGAANVIHVAKAIDFLDERFAIRTVQRPIHRLGEEADPRAAEMHVRLLAGEQKQLVVMDVTLEPGEGHAFHRHDGQEEVIIVKQGSVTQFIEHDSTTLSAGDSVYLDAGVVHASYNDGDETAHLQVVIGPSLGEGGYGLVDVSGDEPWASVR